MKTRNTGRNQLLPFFAAIMVLYGTMNSAAQQVTLPRVAETNVVTAQLALAPGAPGIPIMAVLVNSTNFATATWMPFAPTMTIDLGVGDGPRDVWFGFQFASGLEFHIYRQVIVDTAPPAVHFSSPVTAVVTTPYLQIQGYWTKPMESVSYDLVNTNGTFINQEAFITEHEFNPATRAFATNYFQCFDVPLANGPNTISLRGLDMNSNAWVSTFVLTLDVAQLTNPPAVSLIWPQDAMSIAADSVTLRGTVGDGNMQVAVVVTDDSGNSQNIEGLVERDGTFWLDDIPLTSATNALAITVTDPAGNTTTTNLTLLRASVTLTINQPTDEDLTQSTTTVTGTIDSSEFDIWVNGQPAVVNGDGTWAATNVPIPLGGVATFHAVAVPKTSDCANGNSSGPVSSPITQQNVFALNPTTPTTAHSSAGPEKPAKLKVDRYQNFLTFDHAAWWGDMLDIQEYDIEWADDRGGSSSLNLAAFSPKPWIAPPLRPRIITHAKTLWSGSGPGTVTTTGSMGGVPTGPTYGSAPRPTIYPWEQANRHEDVPEIVDGNLYPSVEAKLVVTKIVLETGGRSGINRQNLFTLSGQAFDTSDTWIPTATALYQLPYGRIPEIPATTGTLRINGQTLGSDGRRYAVLPDNARIDVTLRARGYPNYVFNVSQLKHKLEIFANDYELAPDRVRPNAKYCVGQKIQFDYRLSPEVPGTVIRSNLWNLSSSYVNKSWQRSVTIPAGYTTLPPVPVYYGAINWINDSSLLASQTTKAWYISGGAKSANCLIYLMSPNGHPLAAIFARGKFDVERPTCFPDPNPPPVPALNGNWYAPNRQSVIDTSDIGNPLIGASVDLHDMEFSVGLISSNFPGKIGFCQLVNKRDECGVPLLTSGTGGRHDLDSEFPYNFKTFEVSPGAVAALDLADNPGSMGSRYLHWVSTSNDFKTYLMFKPTDKNGNEADNIWVTIGIVNWSYAALSADFTGPWQVESHYCPAPILLRSDQFPDWTNVLVPHNRAN